MLFGQRFTVFIVIGIEKSVLQHVIIKIKEKYIMKKVLDIVKPGVLTGDEVTSLLEFAKQEGFAMPAVNVTTSNTINAVNLRTSTDPYYDREAWAYMSP